MTESEKENPYRSPAAEIGNENKPDTIQTLANAWTLFVIPFFLTHVVYWPVFFAAGSLLAPSGPHGFIGGAIIGMMIGAGAIAGAGFYYGFWLGQKVRSGRGGIGTQPVILYAIGQSIWFVFSVFAPCSLLMLGA